MYMTHEEYCINYCIIAVGIVEEVSGLLPAFHSAVPSFPWLQAYTTKDYTVNIIIQKCSPNIGSSYLISNCAVLFLAYIYLSVHCNYFLTIMYIHVLMRDEKEERKKQARSNKQQGKAIQHTLYM